jgi:hypothetical protein
MADLSFECRCCRKMANSAQVAHPAGAERGIR